MQESPLISIFMATYNHAFYISEALDSCLMQKTDFPFEIIVCDDCSNDGTREIVQKYAEKHSNIILSFQEHNTKTSKNLLEGLKRIRGKYVAFCEGDDYWISEEKLQKQVDFLEKNPTFSVACHKVQMLDMNTEKRASQEKVFIYKDMTFDEERIKDGIFYADEAISNYFFQTSSVVFRWRFTDGLPDWFTLNMLLDHFLFMLHAVEGKIKYFNEDMSVWRRHEGGYSWLQTINKGLFAQKKYEDWIYVYEEMDRFFSYRFTLQIRERNLLVLRNLVSHYMQTSQFEEIKQLYINYKRYFEKPVLENAIMLDALRLVYPEERTFSPPWQSSERSGTISDENTDRENAIGSFFELDIQSIPSIEDSVFTSWVQDEEYAAFSNNIQALMAFLWHHGCKDIWLPSYFPYFNQNLIKPLRLMPKFYAVDREFNVDPSFLNEVKAREVVLTFAPFGKALSQNFEDALLASKDIIWIEDRSQALSIETASKADACIYFPKNLLGVPDGALLVGKGMSVLQPKQKAIHSAHYFEFLELAVKRMETMHLSTQDILTYNKIIEKEELPQNACSQLTIDILKRIPLLPLAQKRKENWEYLAKHLMEFALWKDERVDFAPYAYPIRIPYNKSQVLPKDVLLTLLANQNIHPLSLGQKTQNTSYNGLSEIVLLPCDQRYSKNDLDRIILLVNKYMQGQIKKEEVKAW